jgi:hypothetical protein
MILFFFDFRTGIIQILQTKKDGWGFSTQIKKQKDYATLVTYFKKCI